MISNYLKFVQLFKGLLKPSKDLAVQFKEMVEEQEKNDATIADKVGSKETPQVEVKEETKVEPVVEVKEEVKVKKPRKPRSSKTATSVKSK